MKRRIFLRAVAAGVAGSALAEARTATKKPNLVYVFADQWRAQATGYAGDPNVRTPFADRLAGESINLCNAVSGQPVCTPYRGSLITGRYPHTNGIFLNDVCLNNDAVSFAQALTQAGYATGYIGKWHLDGHGRSDFIPRERRQGFDFWRVLECTHDYNKSYYYGDENEKRLWDGYDAIAQTREAQRYIREHAKNGPFALFLSWGPPHNPYETAPAEFRAMYSPEKLKLRPNVPTDKEASSRKDLAGYYAHCTTLDSCLGDLMTTLKVCSIEDDTIFVFTSDHGDMLGSQGEIRKQRPWDESIRVPFLLRYPRRFGNHTRTTHTMMNAPDIMPTMLSLCRAPIPKTVEGKDRSSALTHTGVDEDESALLACYSPFGEWTRAMGGREFRGIRTHRYTYIRALDGPWLFYDNEKDPHQLDNLVNARGREPLRNHLETLLARKLAEAGDTFQPGDAYVKKWGYTTDANGTVPYTQ